MRRLLSLLGFATLLAGPLFHPAAQDNTARAAAIADRDAADERYKRLNSAVEDLLSVRTEQDRRFNALTEEVRTLRSEIGRNDSAKYATRDELRSLAEKLQEIENKRLADRKLIDEKFAELKSELRKLLSAPAAGTTRKKSTAATESGAGEKSGGEKSGQENSGAEKGAGKTPEAGAASQEGVWYTVESGNTLAAIVSAHNDEFKKQNKKTSVKMVLDANPGLKPTSMKIGQKVFIPIVTQ